MKLADIEIGKDYAIGKSEYRAGERGRVVKIAKLVKIQRCHDDGTLITETTWREPFKWVTPQEVARPWDEEIKRQAAKEVQRRADNAKAEAFKARLSAASDFLRENGAPSSSVSKGYFFEEHADITLDTLEWLIKRADAALLMKPVYDDVIERLAH